MNIALFLQYYCSLLSIAQTFRLIFTHVRYISVGLLDVQVRKGFWSTLIKVKTRFVPQYTAVLWSTRTKNKCSTSVNSTVDNKADNQAGIRDVQRCWFNAVTQQSGSIGTTSRVYGQVEPDVHKCWLGIDFICRNLKVHRCELLTSKVHPRTERVNYW